MFLWCTDETEHNVFQGVGTSTGHVSSWGGCLWCETGRHLPTVIASSKCPQPATGLAAPQHKLPNCDLAISASSWQFFSYWFLQRGLISSFGAFLSSRQCSFIVDGARILWHGHRLFNGQEGVTHSHNSESIVLTRKKVKTTWHLTWQIFWLLWQMQFWHISLEWWSETCEHCTVDNDMATGHQKRQIWFCCVRLDLQAGKPPADLKHLPARDKAFEKYFNARERSGDRQRSKRWPNMNLWFLINPRRASLRRPTAGLEIPLKPPTRAIMFFSAMQGEMLGTMLLLCSCYCAVTVLLLCSSSSGGSGGN